MTRYTLSGHRTKRSLWKQLSELPSQGVRSFCGMKHVGLNVAADPLYTAAYTGVNGGVVIAVADDQGMHSSQNEQDSRHHAIASKVLMIEPSDSGECKEFVKGL